ncbi:TPA: hypothetical protein ACOEOB_004840, partial [Enterobacter hormaechei subsp. xiangfangensis]
SLDILIPSASSLAVPPPHQLKPSESISSRWQSSRDLTIRATGDAAFKVPSLDFVVLPVV